MDDSSAQVASNLQVELFLAFSQTLPATAVCENAWEGLEREALHAVMLHVLAEAWLRDSTITGNYFGMQLHQKLGRV